MSAINTVPELLRAQASRIPDQPFVRSRGRSVSYAEFDTRTDAMAAGLADLGVKPGDVVPRQRADRHLPDPDDGRVRGCDVGTLLGLDVLADGRRARAGRGLSRTDDPRRGTPHHQRTPVDDGELGEIVVKGPNVMAGYLHNPEATGATVRDGWLHTGDVGYVDADGYFFIVDRAKDMIIRGGENIYPREIEEVLYTHAGVLECAVIGVPDEFRGEEVVAVLAPKPGVALDAEQLKAWVAERLAAFKVPRRFEIRAELPKTPTGKISKPPLREEFGHWAPASA